MGIFTKACKPTERCDDLIHKRESIKIQAKPNERRKAHYHWFWCKRWGLGKRIHIWETMYMIGFLRCKVTYH